MMNFKREFNEIAMDQMINLFSNWERRKLVITHGKREKTVADTYGFPHTSSGKFAGIWNTNVEAHFKNNQKWKFYGLMLTEECQLIAVFTDDEEKEHFETVGKIIQTNNDYRKF